MSTGWFQCSNGYICKKKTWIALPVTIQIGSWALHLPSLSHNNVSFPDRSKPILQENTAVLPNVVVVTTMFPFSGRVKDPQSETQNKISHL